MGRNKIAEVVTPTNGIQSTVGEEVHAG
eukprot:COSAG01_NODE_50897_length_359_cov_0.888462_1_plen_27_part_10